MTRCFLAAALLLLILPVPALAGEARVVSPDHGGNAMSPVWSPQGRQIAYEVGHAQEKYTDLFVLTVDGGSEERIGPPAGSGLGGRFMDRRQVNHEFTWSSNGQLYAFSSSGSDDEFDIWIKGVTVAIGTDDKEGGASFSSDGRYLSYCSAASGDGDLYLLDIYALEDPPTRLTDNPGLDFYGVWSPTEASIVYTKMTEQGANIHLIEDAAGTPSDRALTDWQSTQIKPSWSPDGKWVAFFSNHGVSERTSFDIYVVQAAGGEPFRAVQNVVPSERRGPVWTPDGAGLIAVRNDPNAGDPLVRVDLASGITTEIVTGTVNNAEPALSGRPDDSSWRLAFVSQGVRGSETQAWRRVWTIDIPARPR
jgi:Tol biopolymer transport system component